MKRYKLDLTQVGNEIRPIMTANSDGAWVSVVELDDWMEQNDIVGWQGEKKIERLQRELREAREAVGEGWFAGGATLAQAIRRKVRFLEERLPEDPVLTCARCGPTPHRWRPSPEAGPHWRCSECGEITGPEGGAR